LNKPIFQTGEFKLHSGKNSNWKIECDNLTREDWHTLAQISSKIIGEFDKVFSCGGAADFFAQELKEFSTKTGPSLIVDDVLTSGNTMERVKKNFQAIWNIEVKGIVAFARGPCPSWITPIFTLTRCSGNRASETENVSSLVGNATQPDDRTLRG